jgi:hypothetical protein
MKTLEMLIEAETSGKLYRNVNIYYSKIQGFVDRYSTPYNGNCYTSLNELIHDNGKCSDGWREIIDISDDEMAILRNLKGKWLARDRNGDLYCYTAEPTKEDLSWHSEYDYYGCEVLNHLFQMVQWEDNEPTLIADLLKG